jgi:hypothetical protein
MQEMRLRAQNRGEKIGYDNSAEPSGIGRWEKQGKFEELPKRKECDSKFVYRLD